MSLTSRMPHAEYAVIDAINISRLKEIARSPLHYRWNLYHPKQTEPLALGTAAHCAVLEPERFRRQFAVWDRRTEAGAMAPRRGQHWDTFVASCVGKEIITADQAELVTALSDAVRDDPVAAPYLERGEPEVVMEWEMDGRKRKGRVDWLTTVDGQPCIVGLKSARDCRPFQFGAAAARLGYHLQWAWYYDGFLHLKAEKPRMVEIVVESAAPHAVVVYRIPDDVMEQGREEYERLLELLTLCERTGDWHGPALEEQILTLPSWVYGSEDDDITELGLISAE